MAILESVLVPLLSGSAAAGAVALTLDRRKVTWNAKRDACLEALEIVNGLLSQQSGKIKMVTTCAKPVSRGPG